MQWVALESIAPAVFSPPLGNETLIVTITGQNLQQGANPVVAIGGQQLLLSAILTVNETFLELVLDASMNLTVQSYLTLSVQSSTGDVIKCPCTPEQLAASTQFPDFFPCCSDWKRMYVTNRECIAFEEYEDTAANCEVALGCFGV